VLFHCHNHLSQPAAWLAGRTIRRARGNVIACCRYAAEPIVSSLGPAKIHLIENGVAGSPLPLRRRTENEPVTIGMLGRISPEKGQAEFLRAARLLSRALPRCRFRIAGEPLFGDPVAEAYRRSLDEFAAGLPVEFAGWREDVPDFLGGLDLLVVPSTHEPGAPRVILEAFAAGAPVVAFPTGGIPEIVVDGETGFLVSPQTPAALAERMLVLLLRQSDFVQNVAHAARETWSRRFTLDLYRRRILAIMAATARRNGTSEQLVAAGQAS
jgi:glycosyltransferase involved in cell wall biosynthesis